MDINEAVAAAIRAEMAAQRITWRELSAASGIPERTLARILKPEREIKIDAVFAIAEVLGVSAAYILGQAESMQRRPPRVAP
jgi:transcriptional regulator with XRE-family HTH domain